MSQNVESLAVLISVAKTTKKNTALQKGMLYASMYFDIFHAVLYIYIQISIPV